MTFCNNCGVKNLDESAYCHNCGSRIKMEGVNEQKYNSKENLYNTNQQKGPILYVSPLKGSTFDKGLAIIVAVLLIAIGAGFFFVTTSGHSAYIGWNVHSIHSTEYVDVIVYINGEEVFSYQDLPPGYYCYNAYYHTYDFSLFEDAKLITITAISIGGWFGNQTDSKSIIVYDGQKYDIDLYV